MSANALFRFLRKNKTVINIVTTVLPIAIGVVGTGALAIDGTEKIRKVPNPTKKDYIHAFGPMLVAGTITVASAAVSTCCLVSGQKKVAAMYIAALEQYRMYRKKNIELNGKEADEEILDCMASEMLSDDYGIRIQGGLWDCSDDICYSKYKKELFLEPVTGLMFFSTMPAVQDARYHLNRNFSLSGVTTVDEFLSLLGIGPEVNPYEIHPDQYGWNCEYLFDMCETGWIDISINEAETDDGRKYYKLSYAVEPITHCCDSY